MKVFVTYDTNKICRDLLVRELDRHDVAYEFTPSGELKLKNRASQQKLNELRQDLLTKGISILDNDKVVLVERIKAEIATLIGQNGVEDKVISKILADKFNYTYAYLAKIFSEITYSTIENYTILAKIEQVKRLLIQNQLSLTEISYRFNYSSVAHLSRQFKKTTGLTPTQFKEIINTRRTTNTTYAD